MCAFQCRLGAGLVTMALASVPAFSQWSTDNLTTARDGHTATTVGTKAMFAGGYSGGASNAIDSVEIYDDSTGTWSQATLSVARHSLAATTVGYKALFAGGKDTGGAQSTVVDI